MGTLSSVPAPSIAQKIDDETVECGRMLDLGPVPTFGKDVHATIRYRTRDLEADIKRPETVIHAPDREHLSLELVEVGTEILTLHLSLALAEQLYRLGIDTRLIPLLESFFSQERSIV